MSFTWEWALAIFVFLFANLFLGVQLLKLFWPLRMLKLTAKMRKEAVDPQSWLGLAADENAVRAALPIRQAVFLLQKGTLSEDEVKYRKLWLRSWAYTIATLVLVYVQPQLASGSEAAMSLTLVLCQSLAAYAQGLLIKALADFRRTRIQKVLDAGARSPIMGSNLNRECSIMIQNRLMQMHRNPNRPENLIRQTVRGVRKILVVHKKEPPFLLIRTAAHMFLAGAERQSCA